MLKLFDGIQQPKLIDMADSTWKLMADHLVDSSQHVRRCRSTWSTKPPVVDVFLQNEDLRRGGHHDLKSVGEVGQAYSFSIYFYVVDVWVNG